MPVITPLSGSLFQIAEAVAPALVTSGLSGEIGASRVDQFLRGQAPILETISRRDEASPGVSGPSGLIFGSPKELLAIALEQGASDPLSLTCTGLLCDSVFVQGGLGWPTPIRQIGRMIAARDDQQTLPWAIAALPLGQNIVLNGRALKGMTVSSRLNERVLLPTARSTHLMIRAGGQPLLPNATTYLGGDLWHDRQGLLPKVALHEASHYTNIRVLNSWIDDNAARPVEARDAAFTRHCHPVSDGSYRVDFHFATLFLELAACIATGTFFDTILESGGSESPLLQALVEESAIRGVYYMTDPTYKSYLEQAGIAPPNLKDPGSITRTMQMFVALVSRESAGI